ncbi:MAG: cupin domain-containing protein [Candidatus Dadabacteria bacterium]|nr:cupin domain-containing protein [Candidatus Dadabacteria bacterium]MCZ6555472.1 cupin domain-containing protein [Candidatus Dadabacteria bacterium]
MLTAEKLIKMLNMKPLPKEGGYYCETHRSTHVIHGSSLPQQYESERALSTAIYYLLTPDTQSLLHRLPTDEIFHFYLGDPVLMLQLYPDGTVKTILLGQDIDAGHFVQVIVPKGVWQGSYLLEGGRFALMGTTMAPGFDFADNEIGDRETLISLYPSRQDVIRRLTL